MATKVRIEIPIGKEVSYIKKNPSVANMKLVNVNVISMSGDEFRLITTGFDTTDKVIEHFKLSDLITIVRVDKERKLISVGDTLGPFTNMILQLTFE